MLKRTESGVRDVAHVGWDGSGRVVGYTCVRRCRDILVIRYVPRYFEVFGSLRAWDMLIELLGSCEKKGISLGVLTLGQVSIGSCQGNGGGSGSHPRCQRCLDMGSDERRKTKGKTAEAFDHIEGAMKVKMKVRVLQI